VASTRNRSLRLMVVPALVAAVAIVLVPNAGQATPKPTLDQVKSQLASLAAQGEVAQERLNSAQVSLAAGQRTLAQINTRVARSQALVDAAQTQVGRLASAAYRSGGVDQTLQLLLADNPSQFLEQASALDGISRHQGDVLRAAAVASQRLSQDKLAASQQVAALQKLRNQAAASYAQVQSAQQRMQNLINSLEASQRRALEAEQAAARHRAAEAARRAAATRSSRGSGRSFGGHYDGSIGSRVVGYALAQVGDSYVWGATGPSAFDCSGLTLRSYAQVGISLPHSSSAQYGSGRHISASQLEPGDLVFYYHPIHHVGIYIGGGMIVHAANPGAGVETAALYSMPFAGAVRPY